MLPTSISANAYLEILITSSYHTSTRGRPAGNYTLSYRLGGKGAAGSKVAQGIKGVITLAVTPNQWNSLVLHPADDIAALWPDLDSRDFATYGLTLSAVSNGGLAAGNFDYLRFNRASGDVLLQQQKDMVAAYAPSHPSVKQQQGLEISPYSTHLNWFGGTVTLPDFTGVSSDQYFAYLTSTVVPHIHDTGGLTSYNHPFGAGPRPGLTQAQQDTLVRNAATEMLGNRALDCDILEVGYTGRGGANLLHHIALWDALSRNSLFLTGNGVTDDHMGRDWVSLGNNWCTAAWSGDTSEASLLAALAAGRAYCGSLSKYRGALDLLVDGSCPMGSASVSSLGTRQLTLTASNIPVGGAVQLMQGTVDYAGAALPDPNTQLIGSYTSADLVGDAATTSIDTSAESFIRTQVVDSTGAVVGLSNPIWLLRNPPPDGIPAARVA